MIQKEKTSNIYIQLANKYNIPHQVVEVICNHPFKFANRVISNDEDTKTFNNLFYLPYFLLFYFLYLESTLFKCFVLLK